MCGRPDILYPCSRMIKVCFCQNLNIINSWDRIIAFSSGWGWQNQFFDLLRLKMKSTQTKILKQTGRYRSVIFCNGVVYIILYERVVFSSRVSKRTFVCVNFVFDNDQTGLLLKIICSHHTRFECKIAFRFLNGQNVLSKTTFKIYPRNLRLCPIILIFGYLYTVL